MTLPDARTLCDVIAATWPAAKTSQIGPFTIRDGQGGGSRVCAATATKPVGPQDLPTAEAAMRALGQRAQVMIRDGEDALDALLAQRGYILKDPTHLFAAPIADITAPLPPVTSFQVWPPLQSQREIWALGGIGDARVAIMLRADCRKASFLGRANDRPAGTVYAGIHHKITMLHALEVAPQDRRQGLAANLTRSVANWGQKHRATHLALAVTQANVGAIALYTSLGMRVVGQYHYRIKPDA